MHQLINASPEPVSLVTLGPKTNVAMLLIMYPDVAARLEQIIFVGGSVSGGSVTAVAEFNVWQDPEAASCVIEASISTTMYGFDLFGRLAVSKADADRFRAHDHPATRLAGELLYRRRVSSNNSTHDYVGSLGDAGAMVLLTNPELSLPASSQYGSTSTASAAARQLSTSEPHSWTLAPILTPGPKSGWELI